MLRILITIVLGLMIIWAWLPVILKDNQFIKQNDRKVEVVLVLIMVVLVILNVYYHIP